MSLLAALLTLLLTPAVVPAGVYAQPVAADQPAAWREQVLAQGGGAAKAELACRPLVPEIALCFRYEQEGRLRWVTGEELAAWGADRPALEARAAGALDHSPLVPQAADGGGTWFLSTAPPGREATVLLRPDWLAPLGPGARVALPAQGVVMAWAAGDPLLDQAAAITARKAWESAAVPISPVVLVWDGQEFRSWAEAVPRR